MKILKANAGALTNFEVLDFLKSRGASRDPTRVIAPISRSEYKVYDYLVEAPGCTQTRESVNKFVEKCKEFRLARAEVLNIINVRPSSIVELQPTIFFYGQFCSLNHGAVALFRNMIIEKLDDREIDTDGLIELVKEVLPPLPTRNGHERSAEEEENEGAEQTKNGQDEAMDEGEQMETTA